MKMRPFGIRARTTAAAVLVVGVALATGAFGLVGLMHNALESSIAAAAATRAADVALLAKSGALPSTLPGRGEALLVQVVESGGHVVAASPSLTGGPPLTQVVLAPDTMRVFTVTDVADDVTGVPDPEALLEPDFPFLVAAEGVRTATGTATVIVAASLSPLESTSDTLTSLLELGVPLVLLVVAATTWSITGRALQPVAAIRAEAESISSSLDRRLPVPTARDEIRDLAETMNGMLDRIEASAVLQRRFTANASHELKSPIAAIRTMVEVAARNPSETDLPSLLDDVLAEDRRLELLVSDLLLLARSDEHALNLNVAPLDLTRLLKEEAASVRRDGISQVRVRVVQPLTVHADEGRLRQLLRNLLDNATRHAVSTVDLGAHIDGPWVVLTVRDDGPGIPAEDRDRVFERFVRLDENRSRREGGTGLGLPVSRAIVQAHGGAIAVVDSPVGATLEVRLPRTEADVAADARDRVG
jgi:signal transduction histidine kinase